MNQDSYEALSYANLHNDLITNKGEADTAHSCAKGGMRRSGHRHETDRQTEARVDEESAGCSQATD